MQEHEILSKFEDFENGQDLLSRMVSIALAIAQNK
jgi:hypothetical protein